MPYIAIKTFPKDEDLKKKAIEKLNEVFAEYWDCPPQAITISCEEIAKEDYAEQVIKGEIEPNMDKVYVLNGEKRF